MLKSVQISGNFMDFSLDTVVNYFENDDILSGRNQLVKSTDEKAVASDVQTVLKPLLFKKLQDYIAKNDCEKAILILECIVDFLAPEMYENSKFWTDAGNCFKNFKSYDSAIDCYLKAVDFEEFDYDLFRKIGDIYNYDKNEKEQAILYYEKYVSHIKNNPYVYNVLGHLYETVYKSDFADKQISYFETAHKLMPEKIEFLRNLALVSGKNRRKEKLVKYYEELLKKSNSGNDCFDYGCWSFNNKLFKIAHKYLIHRFYKETNATKYPNINDRLWNGKESISDKTLLIRYEQGFGDTVMFSRFVPLVKNSAKKVIFKVQPQLYSLIKSNFDGIEVIPDTLEYENIDYDRQIPLLELFSVLKITNKSEINSGKYLSVQKEKVDAFRSKYINSGTLNVGICYCGNMEYAGDNRNVPAELIAKLADIPNVQVYSLQVDNKDDLAQTAQYGKIIDLSHNLKDFEDTAIAVESLDLIVSSDNVILNLAGALGKKTFGIFNSYTDYRWFDVRDDKPFWYKSVKYFQNKKYNDWTETLEDVFSEVDKLSKDL